MNSHSRHINSLFGRGAAVFCFGFIVVLAGCSSPNESGLTTNTPVASDYDIIGLGHYYFDGAPKSVTITPKAGKSGGAITVYYDGSKTAPSDIGSYTVTFDVASAYGWNKANGLYAGIMTINDPVETRVFIPLNANVWADGNIDNAGGEQWFKFTATGDTQYIYFTPGDLTMVYIQLYDSTFTRTGDRSPMYGADRTSQTVTTGNEYYIRVTPSDNYKGGFGGYKIGFSLLPAPPDTDITPLTADTWADGYIGASNGVQWFSFTATADSQYIHFDPGTLNNVNIQLRDSAGATVGGQTNLSGSALYVFQTLTTDNEYFIGVTKYDPNSSGAYKIGFNTLPIPPTGNMAALNAGTWADGNIAALGGVQWFKFTATADIQYIRFDPGTLSGVSVQLYDGTGEAVGVQTNLSGSARFVSRTGTAGNDYYIRVMPNNGSGTYKILFNVLPIPPNTNVFQLSANTWADGNITASSGEQWFKFTATADIQFIHFAPGALNGVSIQLYDSTGATAGNQTNLYSNTLSISRMLIRDNEYYIRVTPSYTGSGAYKIAFNALPMPPDTPVTALAFNTWADGAIAASSGEQWYKFTATADTQYIHFDPGTLSEVNIQLYDSAGATAGSQTRLYGGGNALSTSRSLTGGSEYYIRVSPYSGSGAYKIAFNGLFLRPGTTVTTLSANTWADGTITSQVDVQWYKFTATADTHYIHFNMGTLSSVNIQLRDSTGATVGEQTELNTYTLYTARRTLTTGKEYYLSVSYSLGNGTYMTGFNTSTIPPLIDLPSTGIPTLTADTWENGNIAVSNGVQWFKFKATAGIQYIHFNPDSLNRAYIRLYDSNGAAVGGQTDLSVSTRFISRTVTINNDYYIRVIPFSGDYTGVFKIGFNTFILPPDTTVTTINANAWANGVITGSNGVQWFKFTATADTQYIHFAPDALNGVSIQLYDNTGATAGSQTNLYSNTLCIPRMITTGNEYYLRVTPYSGSGAYKVLFNALPVPPDTTVTALSADTWADGNIAVSSGAQWFKFTATAAAQYIHFDPGTLSDVNVQLYAPANGTVGDQTRLYGSGSYTSRTLTPGIEYYIKVSPYSGSGAYKIGFNTLPAPPDTTITTLSSNTWANGSITGSGGVQWFKFSKTAAGQYIHFDPGTLNNVNIQLYDSAGAPAGSQTNLNASTRYTTLTLTGTDYYIKVTPFSTGNSGAYRIAFNGLKIPPAITIANTWTSGNITSSSGVEWFVFTATANNQFIHFSPGTLSDVNIELYNSTGGTVGGQTRLDGWNGNNLYTTRTLSNGSNYYIRVTPYTGGNSGGFWIGVTVSPALPPTPVTLLTANKWANGSITSSSGEQGEQWFRFTATAVTQYIYFEPITMTSVNLQLYDSTGATVGNSTNLYSSNRSIARTLTIGNDYYIKVVSSSIGGNGVYSIGFTASSSPPNS